MVGGNREFQGSLGIRMVKVFDLIAAGTGLRDAQARKADFDPLSVTLTTLDRNSYYPGAKETILGDNKKVDCAESVTHKSTMCIFIFD
jgi:hypothetical protein